MITLIKKKDQHPADIAFQQMRLESIAKLPKVDWDKKRDGAWNPPVLPGENVVLGLFGRELDEKEVERAKFYASNIAVNLSWDGNEIVAAKSA